MYAPPKEYNNNTKKFNSNIKLVCLVTEGIFASNRYLISPFNSIKTEEKRQNLFKYIESLEYIYIYIYTMPM